MPETETGIKNSSDTGKSCLIGLLMAELQCAAGRIIQRHGFRASDIDGLINPVSLRNMIIREEFKNRKKISGDNHGLYKQLAKEFKMKESSIRSVIHSRW